MEFDALTIFPEAFEGPLRVSLVGKAIESGSLVVRVHDLREWAPGPHRKVDDEPFGGGAGMVMTPGPIVTAVREIAKPGARTLLMSAGGRRLDQETVVSLSKEDQIVVICGRYEGIDARVAEVLDADEISVGDFVLAGGEVAALAVIEAVARLGPSFLGNVDSLKEESYSGGLLEYPQYTRPAEFEGHVVPDVLVSGDHESIRRWRRSESLRLTKLRRPDLLETAELTAGEKAELCGPANPETGK